MTANALCGQRAVLTQGNVVEHDAFVLSVRSDPGGYVSDSCVKSKGHRDEHRDEDGHIWRESVR